jgi:hypothetical protein
MKKNETNIFFSHYQRILKDLWFQNRQAARKQRERCGGGNNFFAICATARYNFFVLNRGHLSKYRLVLRIG